MPTLESLRRDEARRRKLRRDLLEQFVQNGRTAQRILDMSKLTDAQVEALKAVVAASEMVAAALD